MSVYKKGVEAGVFVFLVFVFLLNTSCKMTENNSSPLALPPHEFNMSDTHTIPNLEMNFVRIDPGYFLLEYTHPWLEGYKINFMIFVSKRFQMGTTEVTNRQYLEVMGTLPSRHREAFDGPVENVSWLEAKFFCQRLTDRQRKTGHLPQGYVYRLPTTAEWLYSCRGPNIPADLEQVAATRLKQQARPQAAKPRPVGQGVSNERGLFDMEGNVSEWCYDYSHTFFYADAHRDSEILVDPVRTRSTLRPLRSIQGGNWSKAEYNAPIRDRGLHPMHRAPTLGFRVVLAPPIGHLVPVEPVSRSGTTDPMKSIHPLFNRRPTL